MVNATIASSHDGKTVHTTFPGGSLTGRQIHEQVKSIVPGATAILLGVTPVADRDDFIVSEKQLYNASYRFVALTPRPSPESRYAEEFALLVDALDRLHASEDAYTAQRAAFDLAREKYERVREEAQAALAREDAALKKHAFAMKEVDRWLAGVSAEAKAHEARVLRLGARLGNEQTPQAVEDANARSKARKGPIPAEYLSILHTYGLMGGRARRQRW